MEYRTLGRTGMHVSSLCLGSAAFGFYGNTDHDECVQIIHTALDAGINFIDTADAYSNGESEEIIGKALAGGRRDDVVLATKVHSPMGDDPNRRGNSKRWITRACEDSLRRLGTDWIDLYQVHRADPQTDIDETLGALSDLVRAGKIRAFGASNFTVSQIIEAQWTAERRVRERFMCEQPPYSMLARSVEAEVLPACERYGMGAITYSPLANGWLSGRWRGGTTSMSGTRQGVFPDKYDLSLDDNKRKLAATELLAQLAEESGLSLIHMALAFVRAHPAVAAPIIGPRTIAHLRSQLDAATIELSADVLDRIDDIVPPGTNVAGYADALRAIREAGSQDPYASEFAVMSAAYDGGWLPPSLTDASQRRRPAAAGS